MTQPTGAVRRAAHDWRARIDDGGLSPVERAAFEAWIAADPAHATALAEAEQIWRALGEIDYPRELTAPPRSGRALRGTTRWAATLGAAAALAVAVVAGVWLDGSRHGPDVSTLAATTFETGVGEIEQIELPEGTRITLGARSRLAVELTGAERAVDLTAGVAFFDVATDPTRAFTVTAGGARIRVTGTAFDVKRRETGARVAVERGAVEVSRAARPPSRGTDAAATRAVPPRETVVVGPGEEVDASLTDGLGVVAAANNASVGAWRDGQLVYVRSTLAEIVEDANRYSTRPIEVDRAARNLRLSGTFDAGDVDQLLSALQAALPIALEVRNGRRVLVGTP